MSVIPIAVYVYNRSVEHDPLRTHVFVCNVQEGVMEEPL